MNWSFDISQAPRGRTVTTTRTVKDKLHEISEFVPDVLWVATEGGEVIRSYWIPGNRHSSPRWAGLATWQTPIAWQPYVVPAHPGPRPVTASDLPIIEDVGGM